MSVEALRARILQVRDSDPQEARRLMEQLIEASGGAFVDSPAPRRSVPHRRKVRRQRTSAHPPAFDADDPRHGTANGYSNHGCRCDRCREAWNEYVCGLREVARYDACPNCGGPGGLYRERECSACYGYRSRHGVRRPPEVYDPEPRFCANCDELMPEGKPRRHGRCESCSRYLTRTGRERPERLFRRSVAA